MGRIVEQVPSTDTNCSNPSNCTQIVYGPSGDKLALMHGQTLSRAFVPLPGGATAVYNSSGLAYYRHSDHLGSSRLASTATSPTQPYYSGAYAPFGESYAETGIVDRSFTGENEDTVPGMADFMYREYSSAQQGRWISPDPAGLAAVDPTDPQSWNRYVYVMNRSLTDIDSEGLWPGLWECAPDSPCPHPLEFDLNAGFSFTNWNYNPFALLGIPVYAVGFHPIISPETGRPIGIWGRYQTGSLILMQRGSGGSETVQWWKDFAKAVVHPDKSIKLSGFGGCLEKNRLDNALQALGEAYDHPTVGNVASYVTLGSTGVAIANTGANFAFGAKVPGILGRSAHSSTWLRTLGYRTAGRAAAAASAVLIIGEGVYDATAAARCAITE